MDLTLAIVLIAAAFVAALAIGIFAGIAIRRKSAEKQIGSAEEQARRIVEEAVTQGEAKKKEALLEAKEEILRNRNEAESELKERRNELNRLERRLVTKDETLERKQESLEKKEDTLNRKIKENEELTLALDELKAQQLVKLEEVAGLSAEAARNEILTRIENEVKHEAAMKVAEIESRMRDEAEDKAREIVSLAIQRCAVDHASEATVSVVALPNDDMKGRIIGREGRNIRSIETLTGVDLIIDDTPEAITISSFDPVRREIARMTLEKLISDGRIHPARIEETVEKCRREVETAMKQAGEKATFETNVHGLHPDLIKLLGRLRYRTSYGQNVLRHSVEVSHLSGIIAEELGVDATVAKRAGLLHDIGKAMTQEVEGSHVQIGVDIARKYKESKDVIHAIEAHHNDVEPRTIVAMIVQAADAISAARPGARREDLENYIKRLQKLEEISSGFPGVEKAFAIQAGREIRIMVKPEDVNDDQMILVAREIVKKIEANMEYPGQIKVHVIRESRAIEYAK